MSNYDDEDLDGFEYDAYEQGKKEYAKGYQQGRKDALKPIPIEEYDATAHDEKQLVVFDEYGQALIPYGLLTLETEDGKKKVYDAKGYNFGPLEEFLKGEDIGNGMRLLPTEIKWFIELPGPEQIAGTEEKNE